MRKPPLELLAERGFSCARSRVRSAGVAFRGAVSTSIRVLVVVLLGLLDGFAQLSNLPRYGIVDQSEAMSNPDDEPRGVLGRPRWG